MVLTPSEAIEKAKQEERRRLREPIERLESMIDAELVRSYGGDARFVLKENFAKYVIHEVVQDYCRATWDARYENAYLRDSPDIYGYIIVLRRE